MTRQAARAAAGMKPRVRANTDTCARGHKLTEESTFTDPNFGDARFCRECCGMSDETKPTNPGPETKVGSTTRTSTYIPDEVRDRARKNLIALGATDLLAMLGLDHEAVAA